MIDLEKLRERAGIKLAKLRPRTLLDEVQEYRELHPDEPERVIVLSAAIKHINNCFKQFKNWTTLIFPILDREVREIGNDELTGYWTGFRDDILWQQEQDEREILQGTGEGNAIGILAGNVQRYSKPKPDPEFAARRAQALEGQKAARTKRLPAGQAKNLLKKLPKRNIDT